MLFSPWSETTYIAVVDRVRALIESPQAQVQQSVRIKRGFDWNETSAVSTA